MANLAGLKIAMLVTDGFEESEMTDPRKALQEAGAQVDLISPKKDKVKGVKNHEWSTQYPVDVQLDNADPKKYDALVLPGGVINPDALRLLPKAINFIKSFVQDDKPIGAICHGPWTLINAGGVKGKTMTSWPSLEIDLKNAGARWVDQQVVTDGNLVTSRKPEDIPAFNKAIVELFGK